MFSVYNIQEELETKTITSHFRFVLKKVTVQVMGEKMKVFCYASQLINRKKMLKSWLAYKCIFQCLSLLLLLFSTFFVMYMCAYVCLT